MNDFDLDFTGMSLQEYDEHTVTEWMALTMGTEGKPANTADLMRVAEVGVRLLYIAVGRADEHDDEDFFEAADAFYGAVIDAVLKECGLREAKLPQN
jgi:hypothetical protein